MDDRVHLQIDIERIRGENTMVPDYGVTSQSILKLLSMNKSFVDDLPYHISIKQRGVSVADLCQNPGDILLLRLFKP
jgi:hypothetical protein